MSRATFYNQAASLRKIEANERKEMKEIILSFPFINFLESGVFNGLWPIQIGKFLPFEFASWVVLQLPQTARSRICRSARAATGFLTNRNDSTQLLFFQTIVFGPMTFRVNLPRVDNRGKLKVRENV
jgi:hypothetical protein